VVREVGITGADAVSELALGKSNLLVQEKILRPIYFDGSALSTQPKVLAQLQPVAHNF
jgi:hypothetical protein